MATKKLHVHNLSWNTTEDDLLNAASEHYDAERALVMRDVNTGLSRNYGFVFFDSPEGAAIIKKHLDNTEINGRRITVTFAPERRGNEINIVNVEPTSHFQGRLFTA